MQSPPVPRTLPNRKASISSRGSKAHLHSHRTLNTRGLPVPPQLHTTTFCTSLACPQSFVLPPRPGPPHPLSSIVHLQPAVPGCGQRQAPPAPRHLIWLPGHHPLGIRIPQLRRADFYQERRWEGHGNQHSERRPGRDRPLSAAPGPRERRDSPGRSGGPGFSGVSPAPRAAS